MDSEVNSEPQIQPGINLQTHAANFVETVTVSRSMRFYPVHAGELLQFTFVNTLATICFSVGSAFLGMGFGIFTNGLMTEELSATGQVMINVALPVLLALAVLAYAMGGWCLWLRSGNWNSIEKESRIAGQ